MVHTLAWIQFTFVRVRCGVVEIGKYFRILTHVRFTYGIYCDMLVGVEKHVKENSFSGDYRNGLPISILLLGNYLTRTT